MDQMKKLLSNLLHVGQRKDLTSTTGDSKQKTRLQPFCESSTEQEGNNHMSPKAKLGMMPKEVE